MRKSKFLPSNAKPFVVSGRHYSSMDEACRFLGISSAAASKQAKKELPDATRKVRTARKDAILQSWANDAVELLQARQDFGLGLYSRSGCQ